MKNQTNNKRAEDILTSDWTADQQADGYAEEEVRLAADISGAVKQNKQELSPGEKDQLADRIFTSIQTNQKSKRWPGYAAAAVLLVVGLTFTIQYFNRSAIRNYAEGLTAVADSAVTRLLLSEEKEIRIDSKESSIEYSANGEEIAIDEQKRLEKQSVGASNSFNTVIVPYGKRSQITLSDNSTVFLNSGSKLIYPAKFESAKREVYLEGEAIFEVTHDPDHPFFVITRDVEVKVLGTVFDLSAYLDDQRVSTVLQAGSIELRYESDSWMGFSKKKIVPGTMAVFDLTSQTLTQREVDASQFMSWKDGYLVLNKTSLESIAKKLSRYYNVEIVFDSPELAAETFSGDLDLRNSASQVLELIAQTMNISIFQNNRQIRISNKAD